MHRTRFAILIIAALIASCSTTGQKASQLERVAKDWCLSIRASQVIPVYPLTEDLQPGDMFLVDTPVEDQIAEYKANGFLPLENLVGRIQPSGYPAFYGKGYGLTDTSTPPREWQMATPGAPVTEYNWFQAPRAAFPSYSFHVTREEGMNLAIPVSAVPVGLSFLNSADASGTIQIADAYTYGTGVQGLQVQVDEWAKGQRKFLAQYSPTRYGKDKSLRYHYLRVVNRVYLAGQVNVSLLDASARGASLDAGAPKPVTLTDIAAESTAENLGAINRALGVALDQAPGGSVKLTSASDRSVSLSETFPRPLVIGYLAFDRPILDGGMLGAPVATQAQIRGAPVLPPTHYGVDANSERVSAWLDADAQHVAELKAWLATEGDGDVGLTNVVEGAEYVHLRARIVEHFHVP
jgi:hypothetical protein